MLIFILCLIGVCQCAPYVPGLPGSEWSEEELRIVKAKLHAIYTNGVYALELLYGKEGLYADGKGKSKFLKEEFRGAVPSAPKAVSFSSSLRAFLVRAFLPWSCYTM